MGPAMITTVTAATLTTMTAPGAGSLSLVSICTLLVLLVKKELIAADDCGWTNHLNRALNIALAPLLSMFALMVALRLYTLFR
jgi:hypothetical protein